MTFATFLHRNYFVVNFTWALKTTIRETEEEQWYTIIGGSKKSVLFVTNLWTCLSAVHDGVTPVQGPLVIHFGKPLLPVIVSGIHNPPEQKYRFFFGKLDFPTAIETNDRLMYMYSMVYR